MCRQTMTMTNPSLEKPVVAVTPRIRVEEDKMKNVLLDFRLGKAEGGKMMIRDEGTESCGRGCQSIQECR